MSLRFAARKEELEREHEEELSALKRELSAKLERMRRDMREQVRTVTSDV